MIFMSDTRTDRERVQAGFKTLRKAGYAARMGFMCCGSCASSALGNEDKAAFYSEQSNDSYARSGTLKESLFISWWGDVNEIAAALQAEGLVVGHNNGDGTKAVEVFSAKV